MYQPVPEIYHDDDAEPQQADSERGFGDGSVGIGIKDHKFTCNK